MDKQYFLYCRGIFHCQKKQVWILCQWAGQSRVYYSGGNAQHYQLMGNFFYIGMPECIWAILLEEAKEKDCEEKIICSYFLDLCLRYFIIWGIKETEMVMRRTNPRFFWTKGISPKKNPPSRKRVTQIKPPIILKLKNLT